MESELESANKAGPRSAGGRTKMRGTAVGRECSRNQDGPAPSEFGDPQPRWGRRPRRSRLANQRAASSNITASAWFRSENFRVVAARAGVGAPENAYPNEAAPQSRLFAESRRVDRRGNRGDPGRWAS